MARIAGLARPVSSTTGKSSFFTTLEAGNRRVPNPAAGITALRTRMADAAENLRFEEAASLRDLITTVEELEQRQLDRPQPIGGQGLDAVGHARQQVGEDPLGARYLSRRLELHPLATQVKLFNLFVSAPLVMTE